MHCNVALPGRFLAVVTYLYETPLCGHQCLLLNCSQTAS